MMGSTCRLRLGLDRCSFAGLCTKCLHKTRKTKQDFTLMGLVDQTFSWPLLQMRLHRVFVLFFFALCFVLHLVFMSGNELGGNFASKSSHGRSSSKKIRPAGAWALTPARATKAEIFILKKGYFCESLSGRILFMIFSRNVPERKT